MIHEFHGGGERFRGHCVERHLLGKILPEQPVAILV